MNIEEINMTHEIWKEISWSPDYFISSYGRVKSYKKDKINGILLKLRIDQKGYITIQLPNIYTGKHKRTGVHRLVAEAFIPNPESKGDVNHIDEDKSNNRVDNLEWMTRKENLNYGVRAERMAKTRGIPIIAINLKAGESREFYGTNECARQLGLNPSNITSVLKSKRRHTGGFTFKYKGRK